MATRFRKKTKTTLNCSQSPHAQLCFDQDEVGSAVDGPTDVPLPDLRSLQAASRHFFFKWSVLAEQISQNGDKGAYGCGQIEL